MLQTTLTCGKRSSTALRKNGSRNGQPKDQYTACRHQALFVPAAVGKAQAYAQVVALLVERVSQRPIVRLTGVSRASRVQPSSTWQKKATATPQLQPKPSRPRVLELDEMWTFVGRKKHKVWRWLAVERHSRRVVARVLGCRGAATLRRLWAALPEEYRTGTWYFTDEWQAYSHVLPPAGHRPSPKGRGQTSIVEVINCSLRQKCAVLVRKTCSFSRSLAMHHVRIQLVIDEHNRRLTTA